MKKKKTTKKVPKLSKNHPTTTGKCPKNAPKCQNQKKHKKMPENANNAKKHPRMPQTTKNVK